MLCIHIMWQLIAFSILNPLITGIKPTICVCVRLPIVGVHDPSIHRHSGITSMTEQFLSHFYRYLAGVSMLVLTHPWHAKDRREWQPLSPYQSLHDLKLNITEWSTSHLSLTWNGTCLAWINPVMDDPYSVGQAHAKNWSYVLRFCNQAKPWSCSPWSKAQKGQGRTCRGWESQRGIGSGVKKSIEISEGYRFMILFVSSRTCRTSMSTPVSMCTTTSF